jgi:hypothetical protein
MAQQTTSDNDKLLFESQDRDYPMQQFSINAPGQTIDIELDSLAGYMDSIDLDCKLDLAITTGAGATAPSISPFAPYNIFSAIEVSLGGGAFHRINPYFYFLRELITHQGFQPSTTLLNPAYASSTHYNIPAVSAPSSATTDNIWRFPIHIPLQAIPKKAWGLIPMGTSAVKCKIRLTVAPSLYGTDQYNSPLYGGASVTGVAVGSAEQSYVSPTLWYKQPFEAGIKPTIGYLYNVQERAVAITGAGALNSLKFPDPFHYLRLWAIVIDGTGAPNTTGVTNWELDPMPGFARKQFNTPSALSSYFYRIRRKYHTDMPVGVFVFDIASDVLPQLQDSAGQEIDGSIYQTLQAQLSVSAGTDVTSPARIITYQESLSTINF